MATARRKRVSRAGKNRLPAYYPTYGDASNNLFQDRLIKSDPQKNRNRRTIVVHRENGTCGFTLQSYVIFNKQTNETELLTFVDYVDIGGPAHRAGMRKGDVILSINSFNVESYAHDKLVNVIQSCASPLRMVVIFEDCCRKIELHARYLKLQEIMAEKIYELRCLETQEMRMLQKCGACGGADSEIPSIVTSDSCFSLDSSSHDSYSLCPEFDLSFFPSASHFHCLSRLSPSDVLSSPDADSSISFRSLDGSVYNACSSLPDEVFTPGLRGAEYEYSSLPSSVRKKRQKSAFPPELIFTPLESKLTNDSSYYESADRIPQISVLKSQFSDPEPVYESVGNLSSKNSNLVGMSRGSLSTSMPHLSFRSNALKAVKSFVSLAPFRRHRSKNELVKINDDSSSNSTERLHGSNAKLDVPPRDKNRSSSPLFRVNLDSRGSSRRMKNEMANHVVTEDSRRRSNEPQLVGLRQLCDDFRTSCLQESIERRRKSIDNMLSMQVLSGSRDENGKLIRNGSSRAREVIVEESKIEFRESCAPNEIVIEKNDKFIEKNVAALTSCLKNSDSPGKLSLPNSELNRSAVDQHSSDVGKLSSQKKRRNDLSLDIPLRTSHKYSTWCLHINEIDEDTRL